MKTYNLLGGGKISATDDQDLIQKLNDNSMFNECSTLKEYMEKVSSSAKLQNGAVIRIDSYKTFVEDLETNQFITLQE